jgi:hypothetical protein
LGELQSLDKFGLLLLHRQSLTGRKVDVVYARDPCGAELALGPRHLPAVRGGRHDDHDK